ncbi:MAG: hypothetical protein WC450_10950, partial [Candidatus Omnitrophota bacterium]
GIAAEDVAVFRNALAPGEEVRVEQGTLTYPLAPGQLAVLKLESVRRPEQVSSPVTQIWNWAENKNKAVLVSPGETLVIENDNSFEMILTEHNYGATQYYFSEADSKYIGEESHFYYKVALTDLAPGDYSIMFRWPGKQTNDGWEGESGGGVFIVLKSCPKRLEIGEPACLSGYRVKM